jgi:dihydrofolate reductase
MDENILTKKNKKPLISMISAVAKNNLSIGTEDGKLPWRIPEDFKFFKETTMGHPMIMGRKTFESLPGILPGRTHIVITRDSNYEVPEEVLLANSIEKAIEKASELDKEEIFIIGGAQIYKIGLPLAHRLYLTEVETDFESSIKFPEYSSEEFNIISKKKSSDENFSFEFLVLDRK